MAERTPSAGAVALAYRAGDAAPRVVAKGRGLLADEIIRRAREAGVHVHESPELMGLLMHVDLDRHIPPALYLVIAELLAWLYRTERAAPGSEGAIEKSAAEGSALPTLGSTRGPGPSYR